MSGIRSNLRCWSGLRVLGKELTSGELVHDVLNGTPPGIMPGLVRSGSRTDLGHWFFFYLLLNRRGTGGAGKGIEWGGEFEQWFTRRRFRALWLPWGATELLGCRFWNLLDGLVDLREIILVHLRSWRMLLFSRLRGWVKGRRDGNGGLRRLRKCRGRLGKVGDRSSAEVREVRNGLETTEDGSQIG